MIHVGIDFHLHLERMTWDSWVLMAIMVAFGIAACWELLGNHEADDDRLRVGAGRRLGPK